MVEYVHLDFAGNLDKHCPTIGYYLLLLRSSKLEINLQSNNTLSTMEVSTMEAEYVAMTEAIKETIWLISLIDNLCFF